MPDPALPARRASRGRKHASAKWQVVWVLAPLVLVAAIGVHGLQVSRQTARDAAAAQARRALTALLPELASRLDRLCAAEVEVRLFPAVPAPPAGERWVSSTEMARGGSPLQRWERALAAPTAEGRPALLKLAEDADDAVTESGLPLRPLVEWELLRREPTTAALELRAASFARAAFVTHPSILSPEFLARGVQLLEERGANAEGWRAEWEWRWRQLVKKRAVLHAHLSWFEDHRASGWMEDEEERWLVLPASGAGWWMLPEAGVRDLATALLAQVNASLPEFATGRLLAGGRSFPDTTAGPKVLGAVTFEGLELQAIVTAPDRLFAALHAQTYWLAALLVCALGAELAAFAALRRALGREARLGELKSAFVSSVSHELRAPVASMRLMAENLDQGAVSEPEQCRAYHRLMAEECRRLSALIDNVLDFARIEQDRRVYQFLETDLAALARDAVELMRPRAAQRRQEIREELEPIERWCDGMAVRQALVNLLDNAIKFSPEGAEIRVQLQARAGGGWELAVEDRGPGIPPEEHRRIFERFYRLGDELRRETEGSGIGLSIVEHIVQAHGGRVELRSVPGAGARFALVFPDTVPGAETP